MTATDTFLTSYLVTALWSSLDDDGQPLDANYDVTDISDETLEIMRADCDAFFDENKDYILADDAPKASDGTGSDGQAGHDFWLNRNGHGAGFWDGDWPEPAASILDKASKKFGDFDLYVGDDGLIYHM